MADPEYRRDLYRGAAADYDRFRVPCPPALIGDLLARTGVRGGGRLLDLACGTGQIAFAMREAFAEVWAVDQEPDMVAFARAKAAGGIRCVAAAAEEVDLPDAALDLVAIGNAFHRLRRDAVAGRVFRWLRPGGCLALLWSDAPHLGDAPWQRALAATFDWWTPPGRVPQGWDEPQRARPDVEVLRAAGFVAEGRHSFPTPHRWTIEGLTGFAYSMSGLSRAALGEHAARFERELADTLRGHALDQTIDFAYELARKPVPPLQ